MITSSLGVVIGKKNLRLIYTVRYVLMCLISDICLIKVKASYYSLLLHILYEQLSHSLTLSLSLIGSLVAKPEPAEP